MRIHDLALTRVAIAPNIPAQSYLRSYERNGNHNQSPHELCVDGRSVFGNGFRKPAVPARKQHDSEQRNQPQQHRESSPHALASFGMTIREQMNDRSSLSSYLGVKIRWSLPFTLNPRHKRFRISPIEFEF